ncbi:MAG: fibronectin type III domain-containing protein, partial [Lentisphaeria bacterium]|nr:fibronectin type III domain-containing protein [Lentisphaeria bacterium]
LVNFHYTPGDAPEVRGYTVRVACDASLTFDDTDVTFATLPSGASVHTEITEITAGHVYKLDYAIMGGSVGISAEADLFSVNFHGAGTGTGVVSMTNVDLRDLDNIFITPVTFNGTAGIPVDCTAPDAPTWVEVPDYTQGTAITVTWLDESATGASAYYAEYSDDGFASVLGFKDWTTDLFYALTGLTDGVTYSFRVKARDDLNNISLWSDVESSTQDATAPVTKVTALDQFQVDSFFDVSYEIELPEDGSDFTKVELFYKGPGVTTWTYYGEFVDDTTPLVFNTGMVVGDPDGTFFFYSKGTDHVVNEEQPPGSDGDTSTTVDMTDLDVIFFLINDGDNKTASEDVELSMEVVGATSMQFSNTNNGTDWSPDPAVSYATTADWTLDPTTEGTRTVYARFLEIPSNRWTYEQDDIIIDKTAPGNINNLSAERGLEKVKLAWTNPGGDQTGVEVWRAVWHNGDYVTSVYPEYDDVGGNQKPSIPLNWAAAVADPAWGKVITLGIVAAYSDLLPDRGIYYYAVYPVDGAGLHGGSNGASSISYLLGDVQTGYDGTVLGGDVSILGIAYGTTHAGGGLYNN